MGDAGVIPAPRTFPISIKAITTDSESEKSGALPLSGAKIKFKMKDAETLP